ncbi:MAG TPA: aldose epimerase family protein [Candidatus Limnocylindria bacterium]|nr:aldose epimerase family protein [Candidatus Limnocylindria bacterium]
MNIQSDGLQIESSIFGSLPDNRKVELFSLSNSHGMTVKFSNYGLIIAELHVPDRTGKPGNVVLGFDNVERYVKGHPFFGVIAGRYANRIAKGRFKLDGVEYVLATNNGQNHLHGGLAGFDKKLWNILSASAEGGVARVRFSYVSADGEEGYPGDLLVIVTYSLNEKNEFRIDYEATTKNKATVLNLTNHSYFNLAGQGNVLGHELQIESDTFTEVDSELIPTGRIVPVAGTALDFTRPHTIGERADKAGLALPGYDHNFILRHNDDQLHLAATAYESGTGRVMECLTTQPAVQLWTCNNPPPDLVCTGNWVVPKHGGFCLETQHYPDSPNRPGFPTTTLRPGEIFRSSTVYKFSVRK